MNGRYDKTKWWLDQPIDDVLGNIEAVRDNYPDYAFTTEDEMIITILNKARNGDTTAFVKILDCGYGVQRAGDYNDVGGEDGIEAIFVYNEPDEEA